MSATAPRPTRPPGDLAQTGVVALLFQFPKFFESLPTADPAVFNTGYGDLFARDLRTLKPTIRTVNLTCPGEIEDVGPARRRRESSSPPPGGT